MDRRTVLLGSLGLTLPAAAQNGQTPQTKSLVVKARTGELADTTLYTNSFAVLIGITYPKFPDNLQIPQANSDIDDLRALLVTSYGFLPENILVLKDPQATKKGIEKALASLADRKRVQATDRVLVYFSCHGQTIKTQDGGDQGFLIPVDAEIDLKDTANPVPYLSECIPMDSLWRYLESCPARHRLLIADACFAGLTVQSKAFPKPSAATLKGFLAVPALQAIAAGGKGEEALVLPGLRNSVFTHKLLEVLRQAAASGEIVATSLLGAQLRTSVPDLCLTRTGGKFKQTPQFGSRGTEGEWLFVPMGTGPVGVNGANPVSTAIRLELTGVPAGAIVTVDGAVLEGNVYTDDIVEKSKPVDVAVVATNFRPFFRSVTLERGSSSTLTVAMERKDRAAANPENTTEPIATVERKAEAVVTPAKAAKKNELSKYPALMGYLKAMRYIPGGTFRMGGDSSTGYSAKPVHNVSLTMFEMGATPVTVQVWLEYCQACGIKKRGVPPWGFIINHPAINVSWNDIMGADGKGGFCAWASNVSGMGLSLPTEAQWEYAARGGKEGLRYPWGDMFDFSKLWCSRRWGDAKRTAAVNRTTRIFRNSYGLTDMVGNVPHWCLDKNAPYTKLDQVDPSGPISGDGRCVRGGGWNFYEVNDFLCSARDFMTPDSLGIGGVGFRVIRDVYYINRAN